LVFTSAISGQNVAKLLEIVLDIDKQRHKQLKTAELNRWLKEVTEKHPPAGLKNRQPKLNYMVQEADNPTNFKIYGAHTKLLHWSYKRYLERELRERFGFEGTAIKFWFFEKHVDRKQA
jgi:GTP-binding protein